MLVIRKEQMEVFAGITTRQFEDSMVEYVQGAFPKAFNDLKEPRIREIIHFGWDKARDYGLKSERGVRLYVNLMFLLGGGFDTDPQLPWAKRILLDETVTDEVQKNDALYDEFIDYYTQVAGADGENYNEALRRMQFENLQELPNARVAPGQSFQKFESQINARLQRIFPEKYAYLSEDGIRRLIRTGMESAKKHKITTERGLTLYLLLMYVLGSDFDMDLKYPWVGEILNNSGMTNQAQKIDKLYSKAMELLGKRFSGVLD
jgi:hypothetical protein